MTNIQSRLDAISSQQERNQFGTNRYAYLFKPGNYNLDVRVGFYMQVLGLGKSPDDVAITGAVRSKAPWRNGNATINFWRAVENLSVTPMLDQHTNIWAVSQGTALRRVHVKGNLALSDGGWSSGGFMADCKIDGQVNSGTQQQWLSRNDDWGRLDRRIMEHGFRRCEQPAGRNLAQAPLHGHRPNAVGPGETVPLY